MFRIILFVLSLIVYQSAAAPKPHVITTGPLAYSAYSPFASPYVFPSYVSPLTYSYDGFGYSGYSDYSLYPSSVVFV